MLALGISLLLKNYPMCTNSTFHLLTLFSYFIIFSSDCDNYLAIQNICLSPFYDLYFSLWWTVYHSHKNCCSFKKKYKGQEEYYFASQIMPSVNRRQSCHAVSLVLVWIFMRKFEVHMYRQGFFLCVCVCVFFFWPTIPLL